jgi:hypothetical protein
MRKLFDEKLAFFYDVKKERQSALNFFAVSHLEKNLSTHAVQFSPELHVDFSEEWTLHFEGNVLKTKDYFNSNALASSMYTLKDFSGFNYYTSEGYLNFNFSFGEIALGRFYDKLGFAPFKNLLIGNHDFHDGYRIKLNYKSFEFSNRFYQLASYRQTPLIKRYLFEHGLTWQPTAAWTLSLHESALYSGEREAPPMSLLNPISIYHATQLNTGLNSNTHYLFAAKYKSKKWSLWTEFLLDDFQVDSEDDSDGNKEPTEFGLLVGGEYRAGKHRYYMQFNLVRNRTYNDPNGALSSNKFVDHGQVIGFEAGSNLIGVDVEYWYKFSESIQFQAQLETANRGDESVFSPFDESFKGYPSGYMESIPFGQQESKTKFSVITYFQLMEKLKTVVILGTESNNFFSAINFQYELY